MPPSLLPSHSLLRSFLSPLVAVALFPLSGCEVEPEEQHPAPKTTAAPTSTVEAAPPAPVQRTFSPSRAGCEVVPVFADGASVGSVCADEAEANGLTVIDLSDTWTPRVFATDPQTGEAPEYRAKYLQLARSGSADLGLLGIAPTMSVVADRVTDEKRVACDAEIDLAMLADLDRSVANAPDTKSADAVLKKAGSKDALKIAQGQLVCAGFLKKGSANGVMSGATQSALEAFRRRNMVVGLGLDADTLHALSLGGDELAFRGLLRVLREHVADAAGLVEDGSALEQKELVVERDLDLSRFELPSRGSLPNAAPDLVDLATDAAARALGWKSPEGARAFLAAQGKNGLHELRVAVALPPVPAYHSASMDLHVEIDRGDVSYEPGKGAGARRPSFVVYAKDGERDVALFRWATTIGGWKKERTDEGEVVVKYKESDVGDRVWRQILAAPAWLPPDSTPEGDLVYEDRDGNVALKRDLIQPGFQNAYGLVMIIHEEEVKRGSKTTWIDRGIRTHGSVDYRSIQRGTSHGCHRLYNQLALRLSGFLVQHRPNVRKGKTSTAYHRTLEYKDSTVEVDVPSRGYLYELDPPVPVRVLEGNVVGAQKPVAVIHVDEPKKS